MILFVSFLSFQIHCLLCNALNYRLKFQICVFKGKIKTLEKMFKKPRKDEKQVLLYIHISQFEISEAD